MLKRLITGLLIGAVIGAAIAAVLVQGLGISSFVASGALAYLAAAATGVLTGLVAGKPIWSADGKIEAGLKAFFGTLLAVGAMFALRQWVHVGVDLAGLKAGTGEIGQLPAASLPLIAAMLGGFFELDNTPAPADKQAQKVGSAAAGEKLRLASDEAEEEEEAPDSAAAKKKRR